MNDKEDYDEGVDEPIAPVVPVVEISHNRSPRNSRNYEDDV